jgi:uncharacterized protein
MAMGYSLVTLVLIASLSSNATTITSAEVDRLRMHADAGRDNTAITTLIQHAERNNIEAQRAAGEALIKRASQPEAKAGIVWLERAAAQGDTRAMLTLGKTWLYGAPALSPNADKARLWLNRANPANNPQAAYYLGLMARGAAPVDAIKHFTFAAKHDIADAMYWLGNAYANGEGVDIDAREAMRWYLRAAGHDHPLAIQEIAQAYQRGDSLLPQSDFQAQMMLRAVEHALKHPKTAP